MMEYPEIQDKIIETKELQGERGIYYKPN